MLSYTRVGLIKPDGQALLQTTDLDCYPLGQSVQEVQLSGERIAAISGGWLWAGQGGPDATLHLQRRDVYRFLLTTEYLLVITLQGELYARPGALSGSGAWQYLTDHVLAVRSTAQHIGVLKEDGTYREIAGLQGTWQSPLDPFLPPASRAFRDFALNGLRGCVLWRDADVFELWEHQPPDWTTHTAEHPFSTGFVRGFQLEGTRLGVLGKNGRLYVIDGRIDSNAVKIADDATAFQLSGSAVGYLDGASTLYVKDGALSQAWTKAAERVSSFALLAHEAQSGLPAGTYIAALSDGVLLTANTLDLLQRYGMMSLGFRGDYARLALVGHPSAGDERARQTEGTPLLWPQHAAAGDMVVLGPPQQPVVQGRWYDGDWYQVAALDLEAGKRHYFILKETGAQNGAGHALLLTREPASQPVPIFEQGQLACRDQPVPLTSGARASQARPHVLSYTPPTSGRHYLHAWTYPDPPDGYFAQGGYQITYPASPYVLGWHSYPFDNYPGEADEDLFRAVFGLSADPLTPVLRWYYDAIFAPTYGDGQCYGIMVTTNLFYRGVFGPKVTDFSAVAACAHDLTRDSASDGDESLERHIGKYFAYQLNPDVHDAWVFCAYGELHQKIQEALLDDWHDPLGLMMSKPFGSGHAVNIIGLHPGSAAGKTSVAVYDNNTADKYQWISAGQAVPPAPESSVTSYFNLYVVPASVHEKDHVDLPYAGGGGSGGMGVSHGAQGMRLLHVDAQGRRLGVDASGAELAEIPGGYRLALLTGGLTPGWQPPLQYYLPGGAAYTVELRRAGGGPLDYRLFSGDSLFHAQSEAPSAAGVTRVTAALAAGSFGLETQRAGQPVSLKLFREPAGAPPRAYELAYTTAHQRQQVRVSTNPAGDRLSVELQSPLRRGFQLRYRLTLEQTPPGGSAVALVLPDVALPKGASQQVEVWDWNRLERMPVLVQTTRASGSVSVQAFGVTRDNLNDYLYELRERGLIRDEGALRRVLRQAAGATLRTIRRTLRAFERAGRIAAGARLQIAAAVAASRV